MGHALRLSSKDLPKMSQKDAFARQDFLRSWNVVANQVGEWLYDAFSASGGLQPITPGLITVPEAGGEVLTRQGAAKVLKVSVASIDRMRADGSLQPIKALLPGKVRFRESDVQLLISKRR
jgi:hypothetical protein